MKIAFVANTSWNIFNFRKGLVKHFLSKGHEVIVLAPKDEYTSKVEDWGARWIETPLYGTGINPMQDLKYLFLLRRTLKNENPDVVLSYTIKSNIYSCLASRNMSIPIICNVSGLGTAFLVKGTAGRIALWLYRIAFKSAGFVFFQNVDDKELFTSKVKVPEEKTGLLPGSGIDLTEFRYSKPNLTKPTKFLMISRLIVEKGVLEFVEAAAFFSKEGDVTFSLAGRFDEHHARSILKEDLDKWVEKKWITYIPHSDKIIELIDEYEVIVLPSYREGTPRTLLEGAAMGRALLASNVAGCKEVIRDGENGFLFEVKNAKSLISKIKLYLSLSTSERLKLSAESRRLVEEKFDETLIIQNYEEVIHRMTSFT